MSSSLYAESTGNGEVPVVLLHGWGLHGGLWTDLANRLRDDASMQLVDLPGHGRSVSTRLHTEVDAVADEIAHQVAPDGVWVGWSLGGIIALAAAKTIRMRGLVLIDTTPCFVARGDWEFGMAPDVFTGFASGVTQDYRTTLLRFLGLQIGPGVESREVLRQLRATVFDHGEPATDSLMAGLEILRDTDLRDELDQVQVPTLIIHGRYDRLTPPGAADYLAARLPRARANVIEHAGHAPFLSHPVEVAGMIREYLHGLQ